MPARTAYFLSDFHLGVDTVDTSAERERKVVRFLDSIRPYVSDLYLMGDVFDFWFEYRTVIPRGYIRLLGKLADLADDGVKIHYFIGNHDMWMRDYLEVELGATIYPDPITIVLDGKRLHIGHGDGLGPGDQGYKFIKKIFRNPISRRLFQAVHPDIGMRIAAFWSGTSRKKEPRPPAFTGEDEWLIQYCESVLDTIPADYYVFGHRHIMIDHLLSNGTSRYINLGEWMYSYSYAVWESGRLQLRQYVE